MSRKTIFAILGVVGAVFGFVAKEFGLSIDPNSVIASLVVAMVYIFGEAKVDLSRLRVQANKWSDPKFIISLAMFILAQVNSSFGLNLPIELIIGILTVILGVIFKKARDSV